jgi:hypothetical protein
MIITHDLCSSFLTSRSLNRISSSSSSNTANTTGDLQIKMTTTTTESMSSRVWLSPLPPQDAPPVDSFQATRSRPRTDCACTTVSSKFTVERKLLSSRNGWSLPKLRLQGRSCRLPEVKPRGDQHGAQLPLGTLFRRTKPDGPREVSRRRRSDCDRSGTVAAT